MAPEQAAAPLFAWCPVSRSDLLEMEVGERKTTVQAQRIFYVAFMETPRQALAQVGGRGGGR